MDLVSTCRPKDFVSRHGIYKNKTVIKSVINFCFVLQPHSCIRTNLQLLEHFGRWWLPFSVVCPAEFDPAVLTFQVVFLLNCHHHLSLHRLPLLHLGMVVVLVDLVVVEVVDIATSSRNKADLKNTHSLFIISGSLSWNHKSCHIFLCCPAPKNHQSVFGWHFGFTLQCFCYLPASLDIPSFKGSKAQFMIFRLFLLKCKLNRGPKTAVAFHGTFSLSKLDEKPSFQMYLIGSEQLSSWWNTFFLAK